MDCRSLFKYGQISGIEEQENRENVEQFKCVHWFFMIEVFQGILGNQDYSQYTSVIQMREQNVILQFIDETWQNLNYEEVAQKLQRNSDRLSEWAKTWQMQCKLNGCKIIHFHRNPERQPII